MSVSVRRQGGEVWLDGLRPSAMRMNQPGNLLACARYLGYEGSDAWLCGATGFAFALNVGKDLCPSGPSAWADHKLLPLAANAGLHITTFYGSKSQADFAAKQKRAFAKVRRAIDAGMPVIGCEMVVPEVYLVTGYDEGGHYLFLDFANGKTGKLHHAKLGFIWLQFPKLGPAADDRTTVRKALVTALDLAAGEKFGSRDCGLRSYDNWIEGLTDAQDGKPGFGAAYNAACWAGCRREAAAFLEEAKRRLDDRKLAPHFDEAIKQYGIVAARLDEVAGLFPLALGDDKQMAERFKEAPRRKKAARALTVAREAETKGLRALARLAVALGAEGIDPNAAAPETMEKPAMRVNGLKTIVVGDDNLQLGCMKSSLDYLGVDVSLPWLAGTTGHAFIISITTGICPSTPWNALAEYYRSGKMTELGRNAGFVLDYHVAGSDDPSLTSKKRLALKKCRDAIADSRPCYGYHNFHYQMLARYDDAGLHTVKRQGPLLSEGKDGFEVCIVRPCKPADDRTALKEGLTFALAHAEFGKTGVKKYGADAPNAHGLAAYDRWIAHIEKGDPGNMWRAGPAWYACRSLAAECFAEARKRIPDEALAPLFRQAAAAYADVAKHLKPVAEKFTERTVKNHKAWLRDDVTRKSVLEHLRAARSADEKAMAILVRLAAEL